MMIDGDWMLHIGAEEHDDDHIPYIFHVLIPRNEINFSWTINNNLRYPLEFEFTTKSKSPNDLKIIDIENYDDL